MATGQLRGSVVSWNPGLVSIGRQAGRHGVHIHSLSKVGHVSGALCRRCLHHKRVASSEACRRPGLGELVHDFKQF